LPSALSTVNQIQSVFASLAGGGSGPGFEGVLAQVASLSALSDQGTATAPAVGAGPAPQLGWPLEEGAALPASELGGAAALGAAPQGTSASGNALPMGAPQAGAAGLGEQAVAAARKLLGVPYLWGGSNPAQGLDCSGLVQYVYAGLGISLPRTSQQQATVGSPVASVADAQPGDLVFYPGSDGTAAAPGHVGIYIGNGQMIDAPYTGADVRVDPVGNPTEVRRVTGLAGWPASAGAASYATYYAGAAPSPYGPYFAGSGAAYGVPPKLLAAVASTESNFQPAAVSAAGAEGLMQLMPSTASSLGVDPFDPRQAVDGAARLLASFYRRYGSWPLALAAYNAGPTAVQQYGGIPPYAQTQAYVRQVMAKAGMEA
jgi:cell wall-associated NlpC family hydrolase